MPRAGLSPALVVAEAALLADEVGYDRLTLAAVADRLDVRLPSLYKHVRGAEDLRRLLAVRAVRGLTEALAAAAVGKSGPTALHAVAGAYRTWAQAYPGEYSATLAAPVPQDAEHIAAAERAVAVLRAVLSGYRLPQTDATHAVRALRSVLHGFVTLEAAGGFGLPEDVERSFRFLVDSLDAAFSTSGRVAAGAR